MSAFIGLDHAHAIWDNTQQTDSGTPKWNAKKLSSIVASQSEAGLEISW